MLNIIVTDNLISLHAGIVLKHSELMVVINGMSSCSKLDFCNNYMYLAHNFKTGVQKCAQ